MIITTQQNITALAINSLCMYTLYGMLHVCKGLHITLKLLWLFKWVLQAIHSTMNNTHALSTSIQPILCTCYDTIKIWLRKVGLKQQSLHFRDYKEPKNGTKIADLSPKCWIFLWISETYQLTSCLQSGSGCHRSRNRHLNHRGGLQHFSTGRFIRMAPYYPESPYSPGLP